MIPYGRQTIDDDDISAVIEVLRSDWLTTGPFIERFENAFAEYVGARYAVAVNSGTAALHCAMYALGIGPGDEVIVPPITFAATANCVVYQQGIPIFSDVEPDTLLLDPDQIESKITHRTRAIIAVDYAGHPCDYDRLRNICDTHGITLIADGCHALGARYKQKNVGSLADMTVFSFHPVKHITTGEGGMIATNNLRYAQKIKNFRNHGIRQDHHQRKIAGSWWYEIDDLGFNYRITDIQCALGISQLKKAPKFVSLRRKIAAKYDEAFSGSSLIQPLTVRENVYHAYHLYVIRIESEQIGKDRDWFFQQLVKKGISPNVHYIPVHLHPYYREKFGYEIGLCPVAEKAYHSIISLPIFPTLKDNAIQYIIESCLKMGLNPK